MSDLTVLQDLVSSCGLSLNVQQVCSNEATRNQLFSNTEEVVSRGAFGVPDFYLPHVSKLFFGADRLHFVEYLHQSTELTFFDITLGM